MSSACIRRMCCGVAFAMLLGPVAARAESELKSTTTSGDSTAAKPANVAATERLARPDTGVVSTPDAKPIPARIDKPATAGPRSPPLGLCDGS